MNCKEIQDLFSPYLDQALTPEETGFVEKHLARCTFCRRELTELKKTVSLIQGLEEVPVPRNFQEKLHERLIRVQQEEKAEKAAVFRQKRKWGKVFLQSPWISACIASLFLFLMYTAISPALFTQEKTETPLAEMRIADSAKPAEKVNVNIERDAAKKTVKLQSSAEPEINSPQGADETINDRADDANSQGGGENGVEREIIGQAARGKSVKLSSGEDSPQESGQALSPNALEAAAGVKGFAALKAPAPTGIRSVAQTVYVEMEIGEGDLEKALREINGLPSAIPDGMIVVDIESGDGTKKPEITITVLMEYVDEVLEQLGSTGKIIASNSSDGSSASGEPGKAESVPACAAIKVKLTTSSD